MSKNSNQKKEAKKKYDPSMAKPWISMRTGLKVVAVASILMAALTAWQVIPTKGWVEGILWGLLFGALIWGIFFGNVLINRLLHK